MLKHWKTLQQGWVNALDTLHGLFLIPDNLLCMGESLKEGDMGVYGIGLFLMRYFGNFNFNVRYCGVV